MNGNTVGAAGSLMASLRANLQSDVGHIVDTLAERGRDLDRVLRSSAQILRGAEARPLADEVAAVVNTMQGLVRRTAESIEMCVAAVANALEEVSDGDEGPLDLVGAGEDAVASTRRHRTKSVRRFSTPLGDSNRRECRELIRGAIDRFLNEFECNGEREITRRHIYALTSLVGHLRATFPNGRFRTNVGARLLSGNDASSHVFVTHHPILGRAPDVIDVVLAGDLEGTVRHGITVEDMRELADAGSVYVAFEQYNRASTTTVDQAVVRITATTQPRLRSGATPLEAFVDRFRTEIEQCWDSDTGSYSTDLFPEGHVLPPSAGQCVPTSAVLLSTLRAAYPGETFQLTVGAVRRGREELLAHHTYVTHRPRSGPPTVIDVTPDQAPHFSDRVVVASMHELLREGPVYLAFNHYEHIPPSICEDIPNDPSNRIDLLRARYVDRTTT